MRHETPTAGPAIEPVQIQRIHMLKAALGMTDEDYRAMLAEGFHGVTTCKDLDAVEAAGLIMRLEDEAVRAGVWKRWEGHRQYGRQQARPAGKVTPRQLWKIRDLWRQVSRAPADKQEEALSHFLTRRFRCAKPEWLDFGPASKAIVALTAMLESRGRAVA